MKFVDLMDYWEFVLRLYSTVLCDFAARRAHCRCTSTYL